MNIAELTIEELIEIKRDGGKHAAGELRRLVDGFVSGDLPDYQMSAWLMAAFIRGLDHSETVELTRAMASSGRVLDLSAIPGTVVDKHSTGGVADTTTLVVAPLVAACGVPVAKMSGRGLGHTGGTIDKLESIPGFRTALSPEEMIAQAAEIGVCVAAQTDDVDPADKKMYALRDVTATVPSAALIIASIISKKVAGGADAILLDVKAGSGAFMKTDEEARALATELVRVGRALGKRCSAVITDMDQPLGDAVGNALEVREAVRTLRGEGPEGLTQLCIALASRMVLMGERARTAAEAEEMVRAALSSGAALDTFRRWVTAQGGDASVADDPELPPLAPYQRVVPAREDGYVSRFDAEGVGRAAMALGAGRTKKGEPIDLGAGLVLHARLGDPVRRGEPLATLYASKEGLLEVGEGRLLASIAFAKNPPAPRPLFVDVMPAEEAGE